MEGGDIVSTKVLLLLSLVWVECKLVVQVEKKLNIFLILELTAKNC